MEKKDRDLNLDVLKIIIMLMVMCLHYLSHQNFLHMYEIGTPMYFMSWFLYGVCVVSVDVFVIITGYFMCGRNFKPEKHVHRVLDILLSTQFCSIIIGLICYIVFKETVGKEDIIRTIFPTATNTNWFITAYVLLLILAPIADVFVKKINQSTYKRVIMLMFLFICVLPTISFQYRLMTKIEPGVIVLFLFLYLVGGYLSRYRVHVRKTYSAIIYMTTVFLLVVSKFFLDYIISNVPLIANKLGSELSEKYADKFYEYSSFLVVVGAIALFCYFREIKLSTSTTGKNIISFLSTSTLTVYVCHDQQIFRKNVLWNKIVNTDLLVTGKFSIILLPALMIITVIAIYILFACFHNFVIKEFISKKVMNSDICGKSKKLIINSKIYSLYMRFISGF